MGLQAKELPGQSDKYAAPYQKVYTSPSTTVNLKTEVTQALRSCSGALITTLAATTINWKDAAGNACALPLDDNSVVHFPWAMSTLEASANCVIVCYWNF